MNARVAKKLRKLAQRYAQANWMEYYLAIKKWPFRHRLRFAWDIIRPTKRKAKR